MSWTTITQTIREFTEVKCTLPSHASSITSLCPLCNNPLTLPDSYCSQHTTALKNLKKTYLDWQRAYGELSWRSYLTDLEKTPQVGDWVLDMIKYLLDHPDSISTF